MHTHAITMFVIQVEPCMHTHAITMFVIQVNHFLHNCEHVPKIIIHVVGMCISRCELMPE